MSEEAPTTTQPPTMLLTAEQLAHELQVSRATVYRLIDTGELPAPLHLGRATRWRRSDIEEWLAAAKPRRR